MSVLRGKNYFLGKRSRWWSILSGTFWPANEGKEGKPRNNGKTPFFFPPRDMPRFRAPVFRGKCQAVQLIISISFFFIAGT